MLKAVARSLPAYSTKASSKPGISSRSGSALNWAMLLIRSWGSIPCCCRNRVEGSHEDQRLLARLSTVATARLYVGQNCLLKLLMSNVLPLPIGPAILTMSGCLQSVLMIRLAFQNVIPTCHQRDNFQT